MKISTDTNKYTTKEDTLHTIPGIEKYKPGNEAVKNFFLKITSGTAGKGIGMIMIDDFSAQYKKGHMWQTEAYLKCNFKHTSCIGDANFMLRNTNAKRALYLEHHDLESKYFGSIVQQFKPTTIFTFPYALKQIINRLDNLGFIRALKDIRLISITGSSVNKTMRDYLARIIPDADLKFDYSSTEFTLVSTNCKYLYDKYPDGNAYHFFDYPDVCIADENNEGYGEIIITDNKLKNYRTGDIGRISREKCKCGSSKTLIVRGRINFDIIEVCGVTFLLSEVERILEELKEHIDDLAVEVCELESNVSNTCTCKYSVVATKKLQNMTNPAQFIEQKISRSMYVSKENTINDMVEKGVLNRPSVFFVHSIPSTANKKIRLKKTAQ